MEQMRRAREERISVGKKLKMEEMDTSSEPGSANCFVDDSEESSMSSSELDCVAVNNDGNQGEGENENIEYDGYEGGFKLNPLLIPTVVKEVLNNLPTADVENCRLVSASWNMEALAVLRKKQIVVFLDNDGVRIYNHALGDSTTFPHTQYEICIADITEFNENLKQFWANFGEHIKKLEFRQIQLYWHDLFGILENNLPNLEQLNFKNLPRQALRAPAVEIRQIMTVKTLRLSSLPVLPEQAVERLTFVLQAFPNVEVIEFLPMKHAATESRVSGVLTDVLRNPEVILSRLRRINLNLELDSDTLEAFSIKRFPFQKLQISLREGVKASSFKNWIWTLRPTLVDLTVIFPESYSNLEHFLFQNRRMHPEESIQFLSNLKTLTMTNLKGSIDFVQKLTKLETLVYRSNDLARAAPLRLDPTANVVLLKKQDSLLNMRTLNIIPLPAAKIGIVHSICRCFPNLNCLYIGGIDDEGLRCIWLNLPRLSEVILAETSCTDQGVTGIPLEICNDLLETTRLVAVQASQFRRNVSIGCLQSLRKLAISSPNISDASIILGIVDCGNLTELKMSSPLISDSGIIFAIDKFFRQLSLLDLTGCTEITEQSKFYAKEKLVGKLVVSDYYSAHSRRSVRSSRLPQLNPNRTVVVGKISPMSSRLSLPDVEFFEEKDYVELRERDDMLNFDPARLRVLRLRMREAERRNPEFVRFLERRNPHQFHRFFGGEPLRPYLAAAGGDGRGDENNVAAIVAEMQELGLQVEDVEQWLQNH